MRLIKKQISENKTIGIGSTSRVCPFLGQIKEGGP